MIIIKEKKMKTKFSNTKMNSFAEKKIIIFKH